MNKLSINDELGNDIDLLTKSDRWLELQRAKVSQDLGIMLDDLRKIMAAIKIKRNLQQTNRVAVRLPDDFGDSVEILSLREAIKTLKLFDEPQKSRYAPQIRLWEADGYDVQLVQTP